MFRGKLEKLNTIIWLTVRCYKCTSNCVIPSGDHSSHLWRIRGRNFKVLSSVNLLGLAVRSRCSERVSKFTERSHRETLTVHHVQWMMCCRVMEFYGNRSSQIWDHSREDILTTNLATLWVLFHVEQDNRHTVCRYRFWTLPSSIRSLSSACS